MEKNVSNIHQGDDSLIREFYTRMEIWLGQARHDGVDAASWIRACDDKHEKMLDFAIDFDVPCTLAVEFRGELHRGLERLREEKGISIIHLIPETRQICIEILRSTGGIRDGIRIDRLIEETKDRLHRVGGFVNFHDEDEVADLLHEILALRRNRMPDILGELGRHGSLDSTTQKFLTMLKAQGDDATRRMADKAQAQIFDRAFLHPDRDAKRNDNILQFQRKPITRR